MHRLDHVSDTFSGGSANRGNLEGENWANPTNPSPYNFQWDTDTINNYLSNDNEFTNPFSYGQGDTAGPLDFLKSQGIDVQGLDASSLAFLPSTDRFQTSWERMNTGIGMARTGLGFDLGAQQLSGTQNLLGMTGGQGLTSSNTGFGKAQSSITSGIRNTNQQYQDALQRSMAGFKSDVLGSQYDYQDSMTDYQDALTTALGNISASGEDDFTVKTFDPSDPNALNNNNNNNEQGYGPSGAPNNPYDGQRYFDSQGTQWVWSETNQQWT